MFHVYSWPNAILHLDGDAFFASVMQALHPEYRGKPVVVGRERGIATAISYEAKKYGITRGMLMHEIIKKCPSCIRLDSDFEAYNFYSHRMFEIMRKYSPTVEVYSIDEGFADLKGLQKPLHMNYIQIAQAMQREIDEKLHLSVSVGVSVTKSLAKLASSHRKPHGLHVVPGKQIAEFLAAIPIENVWGIGHQTSSYLKKLRIFSALDFAKQQEDFLTKYHLSKSYKEIWMELRGQKVYEVNPHSKETYKSISRTQSFIATSDKNKLFAKLLEHIERAFVRAREFDYLVGRVYIFLKTQRFSYHSTEMKLLQPTAYPLLVHDEIMKAFEQIYKRGVLYRTTGCTLTHLTENTSMQPSLFQNPIQTPEKLKRLYPLIDARKVDFGTALFDKRPHTRKLMSVKLKLQQFDAKALQSE